MLISDDLLFFLEVARTGRLTSAGRGLGVGHTTVGRRINQLEKAIGSRLFDRSPAGWTLTDAGDRLLVHAETVESAVHAAQEDLASTNGRLSGTARIATPDGFGAFVVMPGLTSLRQRHPALNVEVVTATRLNSLASRGYDLAVTLEKPLNPRLDVRPLADYRLSLFAHPKYLESHPKIDSIKDLYRQDMIGYVDGLLDIPALRILQSLLPGMHPQIQTNNISGQWTAASSGLGIALLPEYIGFRDPDLVTILTSDVRVTRRYWLVIPHELAMLARTRAAQAILRDLVAEHPQIQEITSW
jgi:DNA-binding transcriptional LysR family regulator